MRSSSIIGIVFSLTVIATGNAVAQPSQIPEFVYRADTRSPNDVRRTNGFIARGVDASRPGAITDLSLYNHATGHAGPQNDNSGYISTTTDFMRGYRWLWDQGGGFRHGYIYTIRPTVNFVDVNASLGRFLEPVTRQENEWAALGRIPWYQIVGWRSVAEPPSTPMTPNPQYNPNHIAFTLPPVTPQPELAHFPSNHPAWNEMPWMAFTDCGAPPTANGKFAVKRRAQQCTPFENGAIDYDYYTGYLSTLSATPCGGPCLEGERNSKQDTDFYTTLTILFDNPGKSHCGGNLDETPESIADLYREKLCTRMKIGDKLRTRGGYLLKSADSSCIIIQSQDTQYTNGEICEPEEHAIIETGDSIPGCPTGYQLVTAEDLEINSSICFTQLDLHSISRLAGKNVVSGNEQIPCVISRSTSQTQSSLCKKISRTTPEVVVSSESPEGSVCWGGYTPVNVKQAMANKAALCSMLTHSATGITEIGLADGWFSAVSCNIWQGQLSPKPAYTFCNNGVDDVDKFLSNMTVVKTGETCPAGFELATEPEIRANPRVCYGGLPLGSTARLADSASVTMPGPNESLQECTTKVSDPSALTMAVCKAVAPVH